MSAATRLAQATDGFRGGAALGGGLSIGQLVSVVEEIPIVALVSNQAVIAKTASVPIVASIGSPSIVAVVKIDSLTAKVSPPNIVA